MAKAKKPIPEGFHTVTPQLTLDNAAQAIDWYKQALGAQEVSRAPDYHEFHFWLGLAELRLGRVDRARAALELALENSTTPREHDLYAAKLQRLSLLRR